MHRPERTEKCKQRQNDNETVPDQIPAVNE